MVLSTLVTTKILVFYTVFMFIATILSVDAIKCHSCNSVTDKLCYTLKNEANQIDTRFLIDCPVHDPQKQPFCRKVEVNVKAIDEYRSIRSCGYTREKRNDTDYCYSEQNEGFDETICQCLSDGCNSSPNGVNILSLSTLIIGLLFSLLLRRE